jgi:itaconyl-CoA hydratase
VVRSRPVCDLDNVWLSTMSMNASPVHLDAARAATGPFGSPILAGILTFAMAEGLASQTVPAAFGPPIGWASIKLIGPVRVGDVIRTETEMIDPGSSAEGRVRRVRIRAYVGDDQPVLESITLYGIPEE